MHAIVHAEVIPEQALWFCSDLQLYSMDACLERKGILPEYLSELTQLTTFSVSFSEGEEADISPLSGLTGLKKLSIQIDYCDSLVGGIAMQTPCLTALAFSSHTLTSVRCFPLETRPKKSPPHSMPGLQLVCLDVCTISQCH